MRKKDRTTCIKSWYRKLTNFIKWNQMHKEENMKLKLNTTNTKQRITFKSKPCMRYSNYLGNKKLTTITRIYVK